jgi:hypothetical protein
MIKLLWPWILIWGNFLFQRFFSINSIYRSMRMRFCNLFSDFEPGCQEHYSVSPLTRSCVVTRIRILGHLLRYIIYLNRLFIVSCWYVVDFGDLGPSVGRQGRTAKLRWAKSGGTLDPVTTVKFSRDRRPGCDLLRWTTCFEPGLQRHNRVYLQLTWSSCEQNTDFVLSSYFKGHKQTVSRGVVP